MRELDIGAFAPDAGCALVARGSDTAPEFLVGENTGEQLLAARWRRGDVPLTPPRHLADHLLSYCAAGAASCTVLVDGRRLHTHQRQGSLTLLRADQAMQWQLEVPDDVEHIHLYLSARTVADFAREQLGRDEAPLLQNRVGLCDPWLDSFFRLLISEYETYSRNLRLADSLFLDQTASVLVGYLLSRYAQGSHTSEERGVGLASAPSPSTSPSRSQWPSPAPARTAASRVSALRPTLLKRVEDYVHDNLGSHVRLRGMAAVAGMSTGHFSRAFQRATGMTPHQYVLTHRLAKAREMLRDASTPIATIALRCGFSGSAHFSVTFRHHHALTPSQYRQLQ